MTNWFQDDHRTRFRAEMSYAFAARSPLAIIQPDLDGLPAWLRQPAEALYSQQSTADERRAAAEEFLLLSEEFLT